MNFLDETVDQKIADRLRDEGHDVRYVAEMEPGISDPVVLDMTNDLHALFLTADRDFAELVFRQRLLPAGVVLIRLAGVSPAEQGKIVSSALRDHARELPGAFTLVTSEMVRIRREPA